MCPGTFKFRLALWSLYLQSMWATEYARYEKELELSLHNIVGAVLLLRLGILFLMQRATLKLSYTNLIIDGTSNNGVRQAEGINS